MDGASKSALDNEFGTHNEDEVIKQILTKGSVQTGEVYSPLPVALFVTNIIQESGRGGDRNITQGGTIGHATGNRN